jgi:hypothetical protein
MQRLAAGGVLLGPALAARAQRPSPGTRTGTACALRGIEFELVVAETPVNT